MLFLRSFSAHWCPPCRQFTPILANLYKKLNASGRKFEVIFVSRDKDLNAFEEYWGSHPWVALPFQHGITARLMSNYSVMVNQPFIYSVGWLVV